MDIRLELIKGHITDCIEEYFDVLEIDAKKIANSKAIKILSKIQKILQNEDYDDFEMIEEIVRLFEKNKIDCGGCHDFG